MCKVYNMITFPQAIYRLSAYNLNVSQMREVMQSDRLHFGYKVDREKVILGLCDMHYGTSHET